MLKRVSVELLKLGFRCLGLCVELAVGVVILFTKAVVWSF